MKRLAPLLAAALAGCGGSRPAPRPAAVRLGVDVLVDRGFRDLRGKTVGLITNHTGKDSSGRSTVDLLASAPGVTLAAVFSPEHGFTGQLEQEGIGSQAMKVRGRDVPIHSLYSGGIEGMRPKPAQLERLDAVVFDIQDVGARFYTYNATMAMALEETKKAGVAMVVLDRPNPIGGEAVEGPLLDDIGLRKLTAVAYFPVPVRHGMTTGELAQLHNAEVGHPDLTVIPMKGWTRGLWFDQTGLPWTAPSPNMPDLDAAALYPGVACLEFANVSVGRGTPIPFRWIGAPWLDARKLAAELNAATVEGVSFAPRTFTPTKDPYKGQEVPGVEIQLADRAAVDTWKLFAHLVTALRDHAPGFDLRWDASRKLIGSRLFKDLYDRGASAGDIARRVEADAERFKAERKRFLLYP